MLDSMHAQLMPANNGKGNVLVEVYACHAAIYVYHDCID